MLPLHREELDGLAAADEYISMVQTISSTGRTHCQGQIQDRPRSIEQLVMVEVEQGSSSVVVRESLSVCSQKECVLSIVY